METIFAIVISAALGALLMKLWDRQELLDMRLKAQITVLQSLTAQVGGMGNFLQLMGAPPIDQMGGLNGPPLTENEEEQPPRDSSGHPFGGNYQ